MLTRSIKVINFLLDMGSNPNLSDNKHKTALEHYARHVDDNSFLIIEILLNRGLDIDGDRGNGTIMMNLVRSRTNVNLLQWIIDEYEPDLKITNSNEETVLSMALENKNYHLASIFVNEGVDIHRIDDGDYVPEIIEKVTDRVNYCINKLEELHKKCEDKEIIRNVISELRHVDKMNNILNVFNF